MSTAKKKLTTCAPKTAVAYARYSSARQRDVSIEQQLRDIRAFAEREGYTIIHEYADHAKSGFKNIEHREQFHAMIAASESGLFDTVIAWKVDRFGRDRRESASYKGQLSDLGVSVVYAMEPIPDGAAGCLTEGMLEAIAEWYSRNLAENTKRGQHDNALKCITTGHHPLGYKTGPDRHYAIDEEEAVIVRKIFNLYAEGLSLAAVSEALESEGIRTKNGCRFSKTPLAGILDNEAYIGVYHFGDVRIPGGMPAIIDKDLFDLCQQQRKKTSLNHVNSPEGYLLSGKIWCGFCGSKVYGSYGTSGTKGKKYYYYVCQKRHRAQRYCNESRFLHKEEIEKPVVDFLLNTILSGEGLDAFIDIATTISRNKKKESPLQSLENELKDVTRRIDNINRAISEGIWSKQTASMLDELNKREADLKNQIAYLQMTGAYDISAERFRFIMQKYANGDLEDREFLKSMLSVLVNSVTVYENWIRVVFNMAENVDTIPIDELPELHELPDYSRFEFRNVGERQPYVVEPYPAIAFKIAI